MEMCLPTFSARSTHPFILNDLSLSSFTFLDKPSHLHLSFFRSGIPQLHSFSFDPLSDASFGSMPVVKAPSLSLGTLILYHAQS